MAFRFPRPVRPHDPFEWAQHLLPLPELVWYSGGPAWGRYTLPVARPAEPTNSNIAQWYETYRFDGNSGTGRIKVPIQDGDLAMLERPFTLVVIFRKPIVDSVQSDNFGRILSSPEDAWDLKYLKSANGFQFTFPNFELLRVRDADGFTAAEDSDVSFVVSGEADSYASIAAYNGAEMGTESDSGWSAGAAVAAGDMSIGNSGDSTDAYEGAIHFVGWYPGVLPLGVLQEIAYNPWAAVMRPQRRTIVAPVPAVAAQLSGTGGLELSGSGDLVLPDAAAQLSGTGGLELTGSGDLVVPEAGELILDYDWETEERLGPNTFFSDSFEGSSSGNELVSTGHANLSGFGINHHVTGDYPDDSSGSQRNELNANGSGSNAIGWGDGSSRTVKDEHYWFRFHIHTQANPTLADSWANSEASAGEYVWIHQLAPRPSGTAGNVNEIRFFYHPDDGHYMAAGSSWIDASGVKQSNFDQVLGAYTPGESYEIAMHYYTSDDEGIWQVWVTKIAPGETPVLALDESGFTNWSYYSGFLGYIFKHGLYGKRWREFGPEGVDLSVITDNYFLHEGGVSAPSAFFVENAPSAAAKVYHVENELGCFNAAHNVSVVAVGGYEWKPTSGFAGAIGPYAMQAQPDDGSVETDPALSPELVLRAMFPVAGTYYVWTRGDVGESGADSITIGVDGIVAPDFSASQIRIEPSGAWNEWRGASGVEANRATVVIPTPGQHDINVYTRDISPYLDRLVLTTDVDLVPNDSTPESIEASAARLAVPALPAYINLATYDQVGSYSAGRFYSSGGSDQSTTRPIAGTVDDEVYYTRAEMGVGDPRTLKISTPVAGPINVIGLFAEQLMSATRRITVKATGIDEVPGATVLVEDFDFYSEVMGLDIALIRPLGHAYADTSDEIDVVFEIGTGGVDNASICGLILDVPYETPTAIAFGSVIESGASVSMTTRSGSNLVPTGSAIDLRVDGAEVLGVSLPHSITGQVDDVAPTLGTCTATVVGTTIEITGPAAVDDGYTVAVEARERSLGTGLASTWSAVATQKLSASGVDTYAVMRSTSSSGPWEPVGSVAHTGAAWTVTDTTPIEGEYLQVYAVDAAGNLSDDQIFGPITVDAPSLDPAGLTGTLALYSATPVIELED